MEYQIIKAIEQLKKYYYKPTAIWISFDEKTFYVVCDDIDRSKWCNLLRTL